MSTVERKFRLRLLFQEVDLSPGTFVVGRSSACNLTIKDPLASREHAKLVVYDDRVELFDLESRNGTEVNGAPARAGHLLVHGDRVKIGSYEFVFVVDLPHHSRVPTDTITTVTCPGCGGRCPDESTQCPSCGAPLIEATRPAEERDDATVPVELTDSTVKHNTQMIDEVISMALSVEHYDKAAVFLDTEIARFERAVGRGRTDLEQLGRICEHSLVLARAFEDAGRIDWVVRTWSDLQAGMPPSLLDALDQAARGWHDIEPALTRYLGQLTITEANEPTRLALLERLRVLTRRNQS